MPKPFFLIGSLVGGGMVLLIVVLGVLLFLASCAPRELKDRKLDQRTAVDLDGIGSVSLPPTFKLQGIVNSGDRNWFGGETTSLEYHLDKRRISFRFEQGQHTRVGGYSANPVLMDVTLFNDTVSVAEMSRIDSTTIDIFYSPTGRSTLSDVEWLPDARSGAALTRAGKVAKTVASDDAERWLVIHVDPSRRTRVDFYAWTRVYTVAEATKLVSDVAASAARTPALAKHFADIDTFDERMERRRDAKLAELATQLEWCGIGLLAAGKVSWGTDCAAHLTENRRFLSVGRYLGSAPLSAAQHDPRFRPSFPMAFKGGEFPSAGGTVDGLPHLDIHMYYWDQKTSAWTVAGLQALAPSEKFGSDEDRAQAEILERLSKAASAKRDSAQLWLFHYVDVMFRADEVSLAPFLERAALYERALAEGRIITNVRVTKTPLP
jgi:hypothetical protein